MQLFDTCIYELNLQFPFCVQALHKGFFSDHCVFHHIHIAHDCTLDGTRSLSQHQQRLQDHQNPIENGIYDNTLLLKASSTRIAHIM